jgi:hypothetical protein
VEAFPPLPLNSFPTYPCNLSKELVPVSNGHGALAVANVVNGTGEKNDIS